MRAVAVDERMRGFAAHLRLNGYPLGVGETAAAMQALALFPPPTISTAKNILRALFAADQGEWARFGELFDAYWLGRGVRAAQPAAYSPATRQLWRAALPMLAEGGGGKREAADDNFEEDNNEAGGEATRRQQGSGKPGGGGDRPPPPANKEQIQQCGARLAAALTRRRSRRLVAGKKGAGIHFRRTIRKNMSAGGEPLNLMRQTRKTRPAKLAVLLDVSASMRDHSFFFLFLLKGMLLSSANVEAFIFHTRLVRLSGVRNAPGGAAKSLEKFALQTQGVGGGTRIAGCLADFMRLYGGRALGGRAAALVISDGYDSEQGGQLAKTLAALRRVAPRLFWLSPVAGGGELPAALAAARQHINALAAARTVAEIDQLPQQWGEI